MVARTSTTRPARLLVVLLLAVLAITAAFAASWPADQFRVYTREPTHTETTTDPDLWDHSFALLVDSGETEQTFNTASAANWANEILAILRGAGHRPPALPVYKKDGTADHYRLYIFPFAKSRSVRDLSTAGAGYSYVCPGSKKVPWMGVNADARNRMLAKGQYWGITHELVHALNYGDRLFDACEASSFEISEGIPDGVAAHLTNRKWSNYSGGLDLSNTGAGLRSYGLPFFYFTNTMEKDKSELEKHTGYGTGSFWRFLIERFGGLKLIAHLTTKSLPADTTKEEAYKWLDERLQSWPPLSSSTAVGDGGTAPGMYEVFPAFIAEFASYGGARYMNLDWRRFADPRKASEHWLAKAFGPCAKITVTPEQKVGTAQLLIEQVAARCVHVRYEGFKSKFISSPEVLHDNLAVLDGIHMGWVWKRGDLNENCYRKRKSERQKWPPCTYKAFVKTGPQPGTYARAWPSEFIYPKGASTVERVYVFTNVAVQPWKTGWFKTMTVKIGVSAGTLNDQPAQPLAGLPVPRNSKSTKAVKSLQELDKEDLYGLQTEPPAPPTGITGFTLYKPGAEGASSDLEGYGVSINGLKYRQTGPIYGIVVAHPSKGEVAKGVVSSAHCKIESKQPIGEVLQNDEDGLHIRIQASLCLAGPQTLKPCDSPAGCPKVDHVSGEQFLAFGWRQFPETAPTDIRTPGIERYINTMPDSWDKAMTFGFGSELPNGGRPGSGGIGETPMDSSSGPAPDSGTATGGNLTDCACTCEEYAATETAAQVLKARNRTGEEMSMAEISNLMRCSQPCQREYRMCVFQAAEERKEKKKAAKEKRRRDLKANCDCSCEALTSLEQRQRAMQEAMNKGQIPDNEEIIALVECQEPCQQAFHACYMSRSRK